MFYLSDPVGIISHVNVVLIYAAMHPHCLLGRAWMSWLSRLPPSFWLSKVVNILMIFFIPNSNQWLSISNYFALMKQVFINKWKYFVDSRTWIIKIMVNQFIRYALNIVKFRWLKFKIFKPIVSGKSSFVWSSYDAIFVQILDLFSIDGSFDHNLLKMNQVFKIVVL